MPESTLTTALGSHYIWQPPARDIAILLNLDVVDRLQRLVQASRGQEIGGVLLGRCEYANSVSERRIVTIEDFEEIASEHVRGPAYALSPQDKKGLDRVLMRIRRRDEIAPVGFFRSHLRKGLYLDEADFSLFRTHFSGPCDVFLVARPEADAPPVAGFFVWEDGTLERRSSYSHFPLDRLNLESQVPVSVPETPVSSVAPPPPTPVTMPGRLADIPVVEAPPVRHVVEAPPSRRPTRVLATAPRRHKIVIENPRFAKRTIYGTLGVLMVLTALAWAVMMHSAIPETTEAPSTMSLNVEGDPHGLLLHWNPDSTAVEQAQGGVLWISDGGGRKRIDLTKEALESGSLAYTPSTNDVTFHLYLTGPGNAESESVRYVGGRQEVLARDAEPVPPPPTAAPVREREVPPAIQTVARKEVRNDPPHNGGAREEPARNDRQREDVEQADRKTPQIEAPAPQPPPVQPPPPQLTAKAEPAPEPQIVEHDQTPKVIEKPVQQAPPPRPRVREPIISINTEPIPPSRSRSWMRKVPLIRVLDRDRSDGFVPARALRQVTPHVPARLARDVPADARVDLKMTIDTEGYVDRIELISDNADRRLAQIASEALSHWRFEPARIDSKAIKSQMIVFVRFRNPG